MLFVAKSFWPSTEASLTISQFQYQNFRNNFQAKIFQF